MNKLLLALIALSAGAGVVHTALQSTIRLEQEAKLLREEWLVHSQTVASAQTELASVNERNRELKQKLLLSPAMAGNTLWSALQTNRADCLPPELRERLMEELGFNWTSSEDSIVVSKDALRWLRIKLINRKGELNDTAATVFSLMPGERSQVEAAVERVKTDFRDWTPAHIERREPKGDVLAHYILPNDPALSVSNNFATGLVEALGRERAELLLLSPQDWMNDLGLGRSRIAYTAVLIVKREVVGNEQRLKAEIQDNIGRRPSGYLPEAGFPKAFRTIFPNGWADVAKREGFELPPDPPKK